MTVEESFIMHALGSLGFFVSSIYVATIALIIIILSKSDLSLIH
jgi:hypothetical protein